MCICVEYDFIKQRTILCWQDIRYALQHEFITIDVAMRYCVDRIAIEQDQVSDLVGMYLSSDSEEIVSYVKNFAESELPISLCDIQRKWIYIVLSWLYDNRHEYFDPLEMVESVYSTFDYPKAIASFVRYMPMQGPDLGSKEKNEMRLMERWHEYILRESKMFAPTDH